MIVSSLSFEKRVIENIVCLAEKSDLLLSPKRVLSDSEMVKYDCFKSDKGRTGYLLGRYASKIAYNNILNKYTPYSSINIENGIFEQPILNSNFLDVSISHTQHVGGGMVFNKKFPIGIDLEKNNVENVKLIKETIFEEEVASVFNQSEEVYLVVWCLREAITKAIKTGLTIPINLLKLRNLIKVSNWFVCEFENFPQYYGSAQIIGNYVFAIAYPIQLGHINTETILSNYCIN